MSRPLQAIPDGAAVMVDANVFVYALTPQAQLHKPCHELIERGAQGAIRLYTTVAVAADVIHRAMVLEVLSQGQAPGRAHLAMLAGDVLDGTMRRDSGPAACQ